MSRVIHKIINNLISLLHRSREAITSIFSTGLLQKTLGAGSFKRLRSSNFSNYIAQNKNLRIAGFSAAFILLILSALSVYPIVRNLNNVEAAEAKNSTTTLSITSTNSASVELLVKDSSGTFASSTSSQKLNFNVKTDNYAGYKLTLLGKDSSYANLKNSSTNTNLTSISTSSTVTSSSFNNGNWGYTLDGTNYRSAPNNTTGYTIDTTSAPNASTAKTYTLGVGAKADYNTKAGTYTNTYVLTAVGNGTPYVIYYKDNTGDSSVANLPTTQDESTTAINVNLSGTIPTRTGYTFSKWCDGTVTNDGTSCSGTLYSASASFGIDRTKPKTNNTTTLYAVWTPKTYTLNITNNNTTSNPASSTTISFKGSATITVTPNTWYYLSAVSCPTGYTCSGYSTGNDAMSTQIVTVTSDGTSASANDGTVEFTGALAVDGFMQDYTAAECSALSNGTTLKLGDTRDKNIYNVTKINGNCWMTQNLRYVGDTGSTSGSMIMKSATSNISTDTTISYTDLTNGNSYDEARLHVATSDQVPSGATYTATDMGVWYNYVIASAGTVTGEFNSNDAAYDICPKGWRLFTSDERSTVASYATEFVPITGGNYYTGVIDGASLVGVWWAATSYPSSSAARYNLYWYDGESSLGTNYGNRGHGYYVRCIKKTPLEEFGVSTMQEIGNLSVADKNSLLSAMTVGQPYNVTDNRDSQTYQIAKLADGNLWMVNNLNLGAVTLTTNLTSANTNISSTVTAATFNGWKKSSGSATYTAGEYIPLSGTDSTSGTAYGTLYNYYAASAGTITGATNYNNANYDICPKGWRLPTGGSGGEFGTLYNNYNSNAKMRAAVTSGGAGFALAGGFNNGTPLSQGSYGYYWSSTWYNDARMQYMNLNTSGGISLAGGYYRNDGYSVRCMMDKLTIADATYMQDVTPTMVANTDDLATATLTDKRDNNTYAVAKINGNLWMTQNLRYVGDSGSASGSMVMKAATSNISADKTVSYGDLTAGSSYDAARLHVATVNQVPSGATYTATDMGVWYNYAAASAGTITGNSNSTAASQSVCPKNWTMPTNSQQSGIASATYEDAFVPIAGGYYDYGSVSGTGYGFWWSITPHSSYADRRYRLNYGGSNLLTGYGNRGLGNYVRCIRSAS